MTVINYLEDNIKNHPEKTAIIDDSHHLTFQELNQRVRDFSSIVATLSEKNVISLISENSAEFLIAYLGIINSGRIAHLIPTEISEQNLKSQLKSANSDVVICSSAIKKNLSNFASINVPMFTFNELPSESTADVMTPKNNDLAYLIYTSGTTAEPKGVAVSHAMTEFTTKNIVRILDYSKSDIDLLPLPLHHSFGLGCFHTSLCVGSTLVLLKSANNLQSILESLKRHNATTLAAIPATLTKLLQFDMKILEEHFSNIRLIMTNSTPIPKNTVLLFKEILKKGYLATYYGLTEASRSTFMVFDKSSHREASVGKVAPGIDMKIVNDYDDDSRTGEIWIRGNNVIKKYWNNPDADKNLVDGWLRTGDIGYFDEEQYLFLKGRNDDMINVGGEKIAPYEIEETVRQISGVEDVAAFGIKHEVFGQTIKLNVVKSKDSDLDKSKILTHCMKNLEKFKIPTKIDFVQSIPKTDYGKVKRFMLK